MTTPTAPAACAFCTMPNGQHDAPCPYEGKEPAGRLTAENSVDRLTRLLTAKTMTYSDALFFLGYIDGSDVWTPQHWLAVDTMRVRVVELEAELDRLQAPAASADAVSAEEMSHCESAVDDLIKWMGSVHAPAAYFDILVAVLGTVRRLSSALAEMTKERDAAEARATEAMLDLATEREKFTMHTAEVGAWLSALAGIFRIEGGKVGETCSKIFDAAESSLSDAREKAAQIAREYGRAISKGTYRSAGPNDTGEQIAEAILAALSRPTEEGS